MWFSCTPLKVLHRNGYAGEPRWWLSFIEWCVNDCIFTWLMSQKQSKVESVRNNNKMEKYLGTLFLDVNKMSWLHYQWVCDVFHCHFKFWALLCSVSWLFPRIWNEEIWERGFELVCVYFSSLIHLTWRKSEDENGGP